jgi:hypothetical protein
MPTNRRHRLRRHRAIDLDDFTREILLTGFDPLGILDDDDDARELWESHREQLLSDWIAEFPGSRPWGWWKFAAPEPMRRVLSGVPLCDEPDSPQWVRESISFGRCHVLDEKQVDDPPQYESEFDYLKRHKISDGLTANCR